MIGNGVTLELAEDESVNLAHIRRKYRESNALGYVAMHFHPCHEDGIRALPDFKSDHVDKLYLHEIGGNELVRFVPI